MSRSRCDSCPETASVDCMRNCTRRASAVADRPRLVREVLAMSPARRFVIPGRNPVRRHPGDRLYSLLVELPDRERTAPSMS